MVSDTSHIDMADESADDRNADIWPHSNPNADDRLTDATWTQTAISVIMNPRNMSRQIASSLYLQIEFESHHPDLLFRYSRSN